MKLHNTSSIPFLLVLFSLTVVACVAPLSPPVRFPADTNPADTTTVENVTVENVTVENVTVENVTVENAAVENAAVENVTVEQGHLLSAFFGLDNGLPLGTGVRICRGAGRDDGMPVIFAHEVDATTVQAGDFRVTTATGEIGEVRCVTMAPAVDVGELRTALLIGEFGTDGGDPPLTVEIVGNLLSMDHRINFKGATIAVTPLPPGPTLVLAEAVPATQWQLDHVSSGWGNGSGCPQGTTQVIRAVWAGGVTKGNGDDADDVERQLYQVTVAQPDGTAQTVAPFALADLGDGDNNHLLCLHVPGEPQSVAFPAGHLADPNGDLNPATMVAVEHPSPQDARD